MLCHDEKQPGGYLRKNNLSGEDKPMARLPVGERD